MKKVLLATLLALGLSNVAFADDLIDAAAADAIKTDTAGKHSKEQTEGRSKDPRDKQARRRRRFVFLRRGCDHGHAALCRARHVTQNVHRHRGRRATGIDGQQTEHEQQGGEAPHRVRSPCLRIKSER